MWVNYDSSIYVEKAISEVWDTLAIAEYLHERFPAAGVKAGGIINGEVLADVAMNFNIDNMEGLAVRKGENGETLVYIVSDDNFNRPLQQTLLMLFELKP